MMSGDQLSNSHRDGLRRGFAAIALAFATAFLSASVSEAGFVIVAPSVTALAGSGGSFDILIENTNPLGGSSYSVGADLLRLALAGTSGVSFTGVSIATAKPYVFLSSGTSQAGGSPFSSDLFPNTGFMASDSEFSSVDGYERTILAGQTFGLAHVTYLVAANASASSGMINVVVNSDGSATSLSDANGLGVAFTVINGSFTVSSATVPEPSAVLLTSIGLAVVFLGRRRWSKATSHHHARPEQQLRGAR